MGRKKKQDKAAQPGFDPTASEGKIKADLEQNGDRMEHEVLAQAEREKLKRLAGRLAVYTDEQLVAELRRRGAHVLYGNDFNPITTI